MALFVVKHFFSFYKSHFHIQMAEGACFKLDPLLTVEFQNVFVPLNH